VQRRQRGPRRSSATDGCSARRNAVARAQRRKSMRRRGGPPPGPLSTLLRSALHTRRPQDAHAARCVEHGHVRCQHSVARIRGVRHRDGGHRQAVRSRRCFARRIDDTLRREGPAWRESAQPDHGSTSEGMTSRCSPVKAAPLGDGACSPHQACACSADHGCPAPHDTSRSASTSVVCGRWSGSFSRHVRTTASRPGGIGRSERADGAVGGVSR